MKNFQWKAILPHAIAVAVFVLVAVIYCKPALEGKVLAQSDVIHWQGMAQDMVNYKQKHDNHWPLWNNNLFGGMPGYQVALGADNIFSPIYFHQLFMLFLPKPAGFFFLLCISFYFLCQVLRIKPWLGILGGLAYAYATYSPILAAVGHDTKIQAMGYMPALLGAVWLVFQKKYWWGAALTALFTSLLVGMNHPQVSYYFILMAGIMGIAFAIQWIKQKDYKHLAYSLGIVIVSAGLGALTNMVTLATTADYAKATMRGGSTLSVDTSNHTQSFKKSSGLSIDYAFTYGSYGKAESFTYLIPGIYGGPSQLDAGSRFYKLATEKGIPEEQAMQFTQLASNSTYWGEQPANSGPVYLGAVICFLFIFGMVYLKTWHKWWILAVCIIAMIMSWGKNLEGVNTFLFNHLPLYNKFRAPSIILILPQLLFPLVAVLTLQQFLFDETNKAEALKKLKTAAYIAGGFLVIAAGFYLSFDYISSSDTNLKAYLTQLLGGKQEEANAFYNALREDRKSIFGADLLRSILLIAVAVSLLWLAVKNKLKPVYAMIALILLGSFDLLTVDKRYLNDNNFQEQETLNDNNFRPTPVDLEILKDTTRPRVFNLTGDPFSDAITSYHHRSVGGYHPAKLSIYDDLLNFQLRKQPFNMQVLDMLNTKYFIFPNQQNGQPMLQVNPDALGHAWFVKQIKYAADPVTAMKAMDHFNAKDTAIVENRFKKDIPFEPVFDSTAHISQVYNDNDEIKYHSNSKTNQFAVFSEIYYGSGWKATIDGKEAPIVQTNYVLRGLAVPPGEHTIMFEFRPASYYNSVKASVGASFLIWLLLASAAVMEFRRNRSHS
ncbi:YfhO family protein [Asinibacterium sp. OR53]|uniref:YfhO family protein n=1 Tax=Asinibacterium sp. OR53 TaxID=925409 RepID=UPI00047E9371|nr:YfhO family protein [Asinibacterium sp. OR53]